MNGTLVSIMAFTIAERRIVSLDVLADPTRLKSIALAVAD